MILKDDFVYTIKEASDIVGVSTRTLSRIAKKHNLEKIDNRYLFNGSFILKVFADELKELARVGEGLAKDNQAKEGENAALKREIEILKSNLQEYEISDNERIEVFTKDEFKLFETRLIEWQHQQKEIEKKETEIAEIKATTSERVEHYKNLFEYQRKQSDRILRIHEKLVTSINELTNANIQRNVIEAKEKGVINDDWKPTED
jgi:DNA-binding Lrp family transcriptional regulator